MAEIVGDANSSFSNPSLGTVLSTPSAEVVQQQDKETETRDKVRVTQRYLPALLTSTGGETTNTCCTVSLLAQYRQDKTLRS